MKIKADSTCMNIVVEIDIDQLCIDNTGMTLESLIVEMSEGTDVMEGKLLMAYNEAFNNLNDDEELGEEEYEVYMEAKKEYLKPIVEEVIREIFLDHES